MAQIVGGKVLREIIGFLFIITWIIVAASGIVGASTALNALSEHALCTNYFTLIVALVMAGLAGIRKFEHIGWLTWAGCKFSLWQTCSRKPSQQVDVG
jgi:hypothetical protein